MSLMKRYTKYESVAALTGATSPEIDIGQYASGEIVIPSAAGYVTITWYVAQPSGTYYAAQDATGTAITQTVAANKAYPIPSALFGANFIQARVDVAGNLGVILKS